MKRFIASLACGAIFAYTGSAMAFPASDYGVLCDGIHDDTTALQAAIDYASLGGSGVTVTLPEGGICRISRTIVIRNVAGLKLEGDVVFNWIGGPAGPMFLYQDARDTIARNFQVLVQPSTPIDTVFQFENGGGSQVTPTHNMVEHVVIDCVHGGCADAIRMATGAGGDNNNDFNTFSHVTVNNASNSCGRIDHAQSKHNLFIDFGCGNNGIGKYIVYTSVKGSFHCIRCRGGYSTIADFYLNDATDNIVIDQGNFEGSARLLATGGPSGAPFNVTISRTRWAANGLHSDNRMIVYLFPGPLTLTENYFQGGSPLRPLTIHWGTTNPTNGAFTATNNRIGSTLDVPFSGTQPTCQFSNQVMHADGVPHRLPFACQ